LNTILLCARHQKRITDDVLNVSKLSAGLITLVKQDFSPLVEVKNTVRMFRDEVSARGLTLHFEKDESLDTLDVDRVSGDSGRYVVVSRFSRLIETLLIGSCRLSCKFASDS
jgi:signal transduction histidine kinase